MILILIFALGACVNVPEAIRSVPAGAVGIDQARTGIEVHVGRPVRWGGTIAGMRNGPNGTELEVVAHQLDRLGRPFDTDRTLGRFLVETERFLDPLVYRQGRLVTVVGRLESGVRRTIGHYPYFFPVASADTLHLWPEADRGAPRQYLPIWYNPWHPYWRHS